MGYYPQPNNFGPLFYGADQKYGLRPGTTGALSYVESRYNPRAVSPQGAQGLTQLMPSTARGLGVSNPFDPAQSVDGGARYFKQGLDAEGGDYAKAAMYYHGGPNTNIWGPKTHAYADNFMGRLQSVQAPQQQPPQPQGQPQMPPQAPPASLGAFAGMQSLSQPQPLDQVQQPQSLGQLASALPQGNIPKPSKFTAGNIMGVLGDALSAYGGRAPTFGPFLREQQMMDKQQGFEREKFQQELAMRMYAMTHPEEMMKAQAFQAAPQSVRQSMVDYENTMHPDIVGVQQTNGSIINQVQPRQLNYQPGDIHPGTDGSYRFKGGDPSNQASWEKVQ